MVQTGEHGIQDRFQRDDGHSSTCKCEIEDDHCWQQKEEQREQYRPQEQLIKIVVARIDSLP